MKFAELMRKYLPLWMAVDIGLALLIGRYFSELQAATVVYPFLLFVMLYPMMINLKVEHIGKALKSPKLLAMAVGMNFLITPLLGALWAHLLFHNADPYLSTGFILKVVVPCSGMVAAWTGYAKGRVESALVIVAVSLILAIFLVPVWMTILAGSYVHIDIWVIFKNTLLIVALPLAAGLVTRKFLVHRYGPKKFQTMSRYFSPISTCGMLAMIFIIISAHAGLVIGNFHWVLLIILGIATLYPLLFIVAILFSKLMHIDHGDGMALGYSVTAKNHAITIGIATTAFSGTLAVLPAAVAPIVQIPVMLLFLNLSGRIEKFLHRDRQLEAKSIEG